MTFCEHLMAFYKSHPQDHLLLCLYSLSVLFPCTKCYKPPSYPGKGMARAFLGVPWFCDNRDFVRWKCSGEFRIWIMQSAHPSQTICEVSDSKSGSQRGFIPLDTTTLLWLNLICDLEELCGSPLESEMPLKCRGLDCLAKKPQGCDVLSKRQSPP